jgi:ribosome-associated heat shock protein Hsp15
LARSATPATADESLRLDKFLWCARFFKSRSQANAFVAGGRVRLRGSTVVKAHQVVRVGDVLTFPLGNKIRTVRVRALATRRGPASAARLLYDDLAPPQPPT